MRSSFTLAAAVLLGAANAVPMQQWSSASVPPQHSQPSMTPSAFPTPTPSPTPSSSGNTPIKSGNPFSFPLPNGFNGTAAGPELHATEEQAGGAPPNGAAPTLVADDLTSFQLIAFNEIFEVAFFTDLLYNVTNNVPGFEINDGGKTVRALTAIQAQEELHATAANAILAANGRAPIQPCKYQFPTTTLSDALALAQTFTDVVMGTLADVQLHLAQNGAAGVVPIISSVVGQEGEQTGFFRMSNDLNPSELPFLTRATRQFAFSALNQIFVVPGSCPNSGDIALPVFAPLTVTTANVTGADTSLSFETRLANGTATSLNGLSLVYINSQNTPVVESNLSNVQVNKDGSVTFSAPFPYAENVMNGLTIAALVKGAGPFTDAEDVAKVALAGPGLIEIN